MHEILFLYIKTYKKDCHHKLYNCITTFFSFLEFFIYRDIHLTGPDVWVDTYPNCGGIAQSPIDIDRNDVTSDSDLHSFLFSGYDDTSVTMQLKNTGHSGWCL